MILVRKDTGGSGIFRTSRGHVFAKSVNGFQVVNVDPSQARYLQINYKFHNPPAGFSLEENKSEPVKKAAPAKPKKAAAKPPAKK